MQKTIFNALVFGFIFCLPAVFSVTTSFAVTYGNINSGTSFHTTMDSGWDIARACDGNTGTSWNAWQGAGTAQDWKYIADIMGADASLVTHYGDVTQNIAVFNLEQPLSVGSDEYLYIILNSQAHAGHSPEGFRIYLPADSANGFGGGGDNVKNQSTANIVTYLGAANSWQLVESYSKLSATATLEYVGDGVVKNTTLNNVGDTYRLAIPVPAGTDVNGFKLEVLWNDAGHGIAGPGVNTGNHNYVLTEVAMRTLSQVAVDSTPIEYTNWGGGFVPVQRGDAGAVAYLSPMADRGGLGYDFGGFRNVGEISFTQHELNSRNAVTSLDVYTSQGKMSFDNLVTQPDGSITVDLGGINTAYVFVAPTGITTNLGDNRIGISSFDVATTGGFTPMTNYALGKPVTLSHYDTSNDYYFHRSAPGAASGLTDGKMSYTGDADGNGNSVYFNAAGVYIEIDLGESALLNTIGFLQSQNGYGDANSIQANNPTNARRTVERLQLEFWNDDPAYPGDLNDLMTVILSTDPQTGEFLMYDTMYQQVTFDDIEAQYMRLTPLGYSHNGDYWALGEVQLGYSPMNNAAIPEPATWLLMLAGAAGLLLFRRPRRKI